MARTGPADSRILKEARAGQGWGEEGYSLYERTTLRPALTVNGLTGVHLWSSRADRPSHARGR